MFFCAYGQMSQKLIQKSFLYFSYKNKKNNVLACILALITSLLKSREYWPKFQKITTKILFLFKIWAMSLYVIHIPDINYYYYFLELGI